MNWKIEIKPTAEKQYLRLDKNTRKRIKKALSELEHLENPFLHPQIRPLMGDLRGDYRLRIGSWRILLTPNRRQKKIDIYAILPRKDAY